MEKLIETVKVMILPFIRAADEAASFKVHVYQVSPALTIIEKHTAKTLAGVFGFTGPRAVGVTCQGGSSSNSLVLRLYCVGIGKPNITSCGWRLVLYRAAGRTWSSAGMALA
ncbi:hypothetical protein QBC42DRAFT_289155 [Cladorrhinum samala]|uniref:Uncharacterized protein n=1 Tax=Cladorrhinum samala TaxID=585594 RepID=A0AAV9HK80_9PEZI|nr:hypothetical protein QBC42DRAFT_289155 [Cladorrhinum samala]